MLANLYVSKKNTSHLSLLQKIPFIIKFWRLIKKTVKAKRVLISAANILFRGAFSIPFINISSLADKPLYKPS